MYDSPEEIRDYSVKGKWRIPINMHIGNMGLAPVTGAPIITAPPMRTGGNIDNKRIGIGGEQTHSSHLFLPPPYTRLPWPPSPLRPCPPHACTLVMLWACVSS